MRCSKPSGAPLLKLPSFDVVIDSFEVFANKAALKSIKSQGLELHVNQDRKGEINLANLVATPANSQPAEAKKENGKPFVYQVEEIAIDGGDDPLHRRTTAAALQDPARQCAPQSHGAEQ